MKAIWILKVASGSLDVYEYKENHSTANISYFCKMKDGPEGRVKSLDDRFTPRESFLSLIKELMRCALHISELLGTSHGVPSAYPERVRLLWFPNTSPISRHWYACGDNSLLFHSHVFKAKWIVSMELDLRTLSNTWIWFRWPDPAPQEWHWLHNLMILRGACRKSLNSFWLKMNWYGLKTWT